VHRSRHVNPAELMDRRVDARIRRLLWVLRVVSGPLELQLILDEVSRLSIGDARDGKSGQVLRAGFVDVESKQCFGIALICFYRETSLAVARHGHFAPP